MSVTKPPSWDGPNGVIERAIHQHALEELERLKRRVEALEVHFGLRPTKKEQNK